MKMKALCIFFLTLFLTLGCATLPDKERAKLPPHEEKIAKSQSPPEEKLRELVIPQMEEAKKVPDRLFSVYARDSNIQDVLLAFSKDSELNIVIDPDLNGKVTIDLKRVTLKEALGAILSPLGWTYTIDGKFVKVSRPQMETRFFTLNYIATSRMGRREIYATTSTTQGYAGTSSPAVPGMPGASGYPGYPGYSGYPGQQTGYSPVGWAGSRTGYTGLISVDDVDQWREIQKGLEALVFGSGEAKGKEGTPSEKDKETWTRIDDKGRKLVINKSTGVIMVKDYPVNLNHVALYLESVEGSSQRQVNIQAKIMEVVLSSSHQEGINWQVIEGLPRSVNVAWGFSDRTKTQGFPGTQSGFLGSTGTGTTGTSTISIPGITKIAPYGGIFTLGAAGTEVALSDIMQAIAQQGDVKILSSPTISTLNNQKAVIRVGNQDVFFVTGAVATQTTVTQFIEPRTIDEGIILDVTPQIAEDGTIIMNIHPSITDKTGSVPTPDGKSTFPLLSVRETDTTVRVRDGQTIIIAGLMQEKFQENYTGFPALQSIPLLGGLFRYKTGTKTNSELVIMITPTLQPGRKVEDLTKK